jgi:hypothetical protein
LPKSSNGAIVLQRVQHLAAVPPSHLLDTPPALPTIM